MVFFIKHLLLVPLYTPRKDFNFFRIFEELFEFVMDSLVYSILGSWDSTVYSILGSWDSTVYSSPESRDSPLYSSPGSWDSPVVNTPGSRPKLVVFLLTCSYACSKYTKKSTPWWIHHRGLRLPCVFITGELIPSRVFTTGELRLPGVFITRESFWTPGSNFTDFKEHTTIFKWSIILKIICRLL